MDVQFYNLLSIRTPGSTCRAHYCRCNPLSVRTNRTIYTSGRDAHGSAYNVELTAMGMQNVVESVYMTQILPILHTDDILHAVCRSQSFDPSSNEPRV